MKGLKLIKTAVSIILVLSLFFCLGITATVSASAADTEISATDGRIRYTGHWTQNAGTMKGYFQSTMEVRFTGTSLQVKSNRALAVKIDDGAYDVVDSSSGIVVAASGLTSGEHKATLIISTPIGSTGIGSTQITGFIIDSGATLLEPDNSKHIAFIGDSITMGHYGASSNWPSDAGYRDSVAKNYVTKTAELLGLVPNATAIGGIGIEQANSTAIDELGMAERYFRQGEYYSDASNSAYNTGVYTPDYVVVALGTNGSYDSSTAVTTQAVYENMLKNLRTAYPNAKIFCVTPFQSTGLSSLDLKKETIIKASVDNLNSNGDNNVYYIDATSFITNPAKVLEDSAGQTLDGIHPTFEGHTAIAQQLAAAMRAELAADTAVEAKAVNVTVGDSAKTVEVVVDDDYAQTFADLKIVSGGVDVATSYTKLGNSLVLSFETTADSVDIQVVGVNGNVECTSATVNVNLARMNGEAGTKYVQYVDVIGGDANEDGNTDVKDLVRAKKIIAELSDATANADLDGDGSVATTDMTLLAKLIVNGKKGMQAHTVTFTNCDGTVLEVINVPAGQKAVPSVVPSKKYYTFKGWNGVLSNITADTTVAAVYEENEQVFTDDDIAGTIPEDWEYDE